MTIDRSREGPTAHRRRAPVLAAAAALALVAAGCGSGGSSSSSSGSSGTRSGGKGTTALSVKGEGKLGRILVDAQGRTLYLFGKDHGPRSTCYGACKSLWPPATASAKPTARGGASMSKLTTTMRTDGTAQLVYDGHPLYYYAPDNGRPGSTKGEALKQFGAEWYVLSPAGGKVEQGGS